MSSLKSAQELIGPLVGLLGFIAWLMMLYYVKKNKNRIKAATNESIIDLLANSKSPILMGSYIQELTSRGMDVSFACPFLMKHLLSSDKTCRILAWSQLRGHFPQQVSDLEYNPSRPSKESRVAITKRIEELVQSNLQAMNNSSSTHLES